MNWSTKPRIALVATLPGTLPQHTEWVAQIYSWSAVKQLAMNIKKSRALKLSTITPQKKY